MYNVKTLEAIMAARTLIEYCKANTNLSGIARFTQKATANGLTAYLAMVFQRIGRLQRMKKTDIEADWNIPTVKTYKQDFLSKFPNAKFGNSEICRRFIYGEEVGYCGMTCEQCWNEAYIKV